MMQVSTVDMDDGMYVGLDSVSMREVGEAQGPVTGRPAPDSGIFSRHSVEFSSNVCFSVR